MSDKMGKMYEAKTVQVPQYVKTTHTQSQTRRESELTYMQYSLPSIISLYHLKQPSAQLLNLTNVKKD